MSDSNLISHSRIIYPLQLRSQVVHLGQWIPQRSPHPWSMSIFKISTIMNDCGELDCIQQSQSHSIDFFNPPLLDTDTTMYTIFDVWMWNLFSTIDMVCTGIVPVAEQRSSEIFWLLHHGSVAEPVCLTGLLNLLTLASKNISLYDVGQ